MGSSTEPKTTGNNLNDTTKHWRYQHDRNRLHQISSTTELYKRSASRHMHYHGVQCGLETCTSTSISEGANEILVGEQPLEYFQQYSRNKVAYQPGSTALVIMNQLSHRVQ